MSEYRFQGKIGEVKRHTGEIQPIYVYVTGSDFPDYEMVIMGEHYPKFDTERVPINEKLWQKIGVALGYKFRKPKGEE